VCRQQKRAETERQRPVADHQKIFERKQRGIRPRLGTIARDLDLNPRRRPCFAEANDVEEPDESIRRLPDDTVAARAEVIRREGRTEVLRCRGGCWMWCTVDRRGCAVVRARHPRPLSRREGERCRRLGRSALRLAQEVFFFFQAEDGIRDWSVTGVQTCALPI